MAYLSYPPEILQNIIEDFDIWKTLFYTNKTFNKTLTNILFAKKPLQDRFGKWYFLGYLKLTRSNFKNNEETNFNEILNMIPKDIDAGTILEFIRLILEDEYKQIFDHFNSKTGKITLNQTEIIRILVNALRVKNRDYFLFKLLSNDKKESLKLGLFKETLYTTRDPILRRLAFTRLENNGYKANAEVTLMFLKNPELNLFTPYSSSLLRDEGILLIEAFDYLIKKDKVYNDLAGVIVSKMKPTDVVLSFYQGCFNDLKSDTLSYDLIRKFMDYSVFSSEFTVLIKKMIEKKMKFDLVICRKVILSRKKKISYLIDALEEVTKKKRCVIIQEFVKSFETLSENRQKEMKERLQR